MARCPLWTRRRIDVERRVFLVETRMRFDQFSAVALPVKEEPSDAKWTRLVCQCMCRAANNQNIYANQKQKG
jgi:hypothetical protein